MFFNDLKQSPTLNSWFFTLYYTYYTTHTIPPIVHLNRKSVTYIQNLPKPTKPTLMPIHAKPSKAKPSQSNPIQSKPIQSNPIKERRG